MDFKNLALILLMIYCYDAESADENFKELYQLADSQNFSSKQIQDACGSIIIFDLSKNVVKEEIFDVSIKYFLRYILKFCNGFKFAVIDDNFNDCESSEGCNIQIKDCDVLSGCDVMINKLNYNNITSSYPAVLVDESPNSTTNYLSFLKEIFSRYSLCNNNSIVLLTNRIVFFEPDQEFANIVHNLSTQFMVVLGGRNETTAGDSLKKEFHNIPNAKTFNFPNYDCLSYLFYCLLPCSNNTPDCVQSDIDDCQIPTTTPNYFPNETLHIWYVYNFNWDYKIDAINVRSGIKRGFKKFQEAFRYQYVRIKVVYTSVDITLSFDDMDLIDTVQVLCIQYSGDVFNDNDYANDELRLIPWSGTFTETRIGYSAIIILTNYASTTLQTIARGERLLGSMYIQNEASYNYYTSVLKNDTNFHYSYLESFDDGIDIHLIDVEKTSTSTSTSIMETTEAPSSESFNPTTTDNEATTNPTTYYEATTTIPTTTTTPIIPATQGKSSSNSAPILIICGVVAGISIVGFALGLFVFLKRRQRNDAVKHLQNAHNNQLMRTHIQTSISNVDKWELPNDLIEITKTITSGTYNQVFQGKLYQQNVKHQDYIEVALKKPHKRATHVTKIKFLNEINMMKIIWDQHNNNNNNDIINIVKMLGCITESYEKCLLLEFCSNLDLLTFVREFKYSESQSDDAKKAAKKLFFIFAWQIAHGLKFLVSKRIIHRGLAAKNVLIDFEKNAKISDFGFAIFENKNDEPILTSEKRMLASKWMAMESLTNLEFSFQSDIWAFGIVLFEMYSFGEIPYTGIEADEHLISFLKEGNRLEKPDFASAEIFEKGIAKCWSELPSTRPTANEIIQIFTKFLEESTEGYGYLEILESAASRNNKELVRQFSA